MADKKNKAKNIPGEERFISSGKSVTLIKPGRGAPGSEKAKAAPRKGKK